MIIALKIKTIQVNFDGVLGTHTQLESWTVEDGDHIPIVVLFVQTNIICTVQKYDQCYSSEKANMDLHWKKRAGSGLGCFKGRNIRCIWT
jgi:hypothetical protein